MFVRLNDHQVVCRVHPVIDPGVRGLCGKPYRNHAKGCPNVGKKEGCPPHAPLYDHIYRLDPVVAVINEFDFAAHRHGLAQVPRKDGRARTDDELRCVLYWQPKARKQLNTAVAYLLKQKGFERFECNTCPEGMGVNVTETLRGVGVELEWPPENIVRQVAFLGIRL